MNRLSALAINTGIALIGAGFSVPAGATVILDAHPTAFTPVGQIHNNGNQSGDGEVFVHTQPGNTNFTLTSPSNLDTNGNGHAQIDGPFHTLLFQGTLATTFFSAIDFNLNVPNGDDFFADILVTFADGVTTHLFDNISLGNGQNKYLIYGDNNEVFKSISFTGWSNTANTTAAYFDDIRQIDVDVVNRDGGGGPPPPPGVPEPATWAMMLLGFGVVGAAMRRRPHPTVRVNFA